MEKGSSLNQSFLKKVLGVTKEVSTKLMLEAKKASLILVLGLSFLQADSKDLKSLDFSNIIASQIEMIGEDPIKQLDVYLKTYNRMLRLLKDGKITEEEFDEYSEDVLYYIKELEAQITDPSALKKIEAVKKTIALSESTDFSTFSKTISVTATGEIQVSNITIPLDEEGSKQAKQAIAANSSNTSNTTNTQTPTQNNTNSTTGSTTPTISVPVTPKEKENQKFADMYFDTGEDFLGPILLNAPVFTDTTSAVLYGNQELPNTTQSRDVLINEAEISNLYPKLKILPTTLDKSTFSFILNNSFSSNDRSYFMANVENDPKLKEQFLKYYKDNKDKIDSSMETSTSMAPFYFKANEPDLVTNQDDINVFNNWLDVLDETSKTWGDAVTLTIYTFTSNKWDNNPTSEYYQSKNSGFPTDLQLAEARANMLYSKFSKSGSTKIVRKPVGADPRHRNSYKKNYDGNVIDLPEYRYAHLVLSVGGRDVKINDNVGQSSILRLPQALPPRFVPARKESKYPTSNMITMKGFEGKACVLTLANKVEVKKGGKLDIYFADTGGYDGDMFQLYIKHGDKIIKVNTKNDKKTVAFDDDDKNILDREKQMKQKSQKDQKRFPKTIEERTLARNVKNNSVDKLSISMDGLPAGTYNLVYIPVSDGYYHPNTTTFWLQDGSQVNCYGSITQGHYSTFSFNIVDK